MDLYEVSVEKYVCGTDVFDLQVCIYEIRNFGSGFCGLFSLHTEINIIQGLLYYMYVCPKCYKLWYVMS